MWQWGNLVVLRWSPEWQASRCSVTGHLTIMGFLNFDFCIANYFWGLESNLPLRGILITLRIVWCLGFDMSNDEKFMQWRRRHYDTYICATTFPIKLQTSNRDTFRSYKGQTINALISYKVLFSSLAIWGKFPHKGFGAINLSLPSSMEEQRTRRCGCTAWTMYTFICPIQKIIRV